jgi:hypothetical protein
MRARKMNCSTKCPLDRTPRATLRVYWTAGRRFVDETVQNEYRAKTETEILRTDRISREKGLLGSIQEPEYWTKKAKSIVYVV